MLATRGAEVIINITDLEKIIRYAKERDLHKVKIVIRDNNPDFAKLMSEGVLLDKEEEELPF